MDLSTNFAVWIMEFLLPIVNAAVVVFFVALVIIVDRKPKYRR